MEDIIGHILVGIGRAVIALGEVCVDAGKGIVRGTIGVVKVAGDFMLDEVVEKVVERLFEREKRKKKRMKRHVEKLKRYAWFKVLYEDKCCQEVLDYNEAYRNLLSKRRYIHKLIHKEEERKKFIQRVRVDAKVNNVIWDM
ncbi:hypothetical protein H9I32_14690 [Bacillus sp. Xin]|uniref:hypothetical protein n=1 Tax=unclassified Bacillus (in: firmicutes) TaxID=185979 RepID=UPI0015726A8D|nr:MULTISPECIES: hypothetical protein [unclassified Bacillus (in: firmicutes)]MBC6973562.1 hypothetical protein [Bacillus sp. Xin]NSW36965.1 hypothetical protein [Bacillus sp. Xin1]